MSVFKSDGKKDCETDGYSEMPGQTMKAFYRTEDVTTGNSYK